MLSIEEKQKRIEEHKIITGAYPPLELSYPQWWSNGRGMMYNRDCLDGCNPEQTYNYIKREYGVDPEIYDIPKPPNAIGDSICPHCGMSF